MSSQRGKAPSSSAAGRGYGDDAREDCGDAVKPVKLSFHEMLSYGHKPWDKNYREEKQALEEAFTQAARQSADSTKNARSSQQKSGEEQPAYISSDDDDDYGVEPREFSEHEMLCYGHKPWDDDYYEWKEAYEKAFTKADRQAAADARREARAAELGKGELSSVKK